MSTGSEINYFDTENINENKKENNTENFEVISLENNKINQTYNYYILIFKS